MNRSSNPAPAKTSASPSVATVNPAAPAASWRRPNSRLLCVFACGRSATPRSRMAAAIRSILASTRSRSTTTAGVSIAARAPASSQASSIAPPHPGRVGGVRRHVRGKIPPGGRRRSCGGGRGTRGAAGRSRRHDEHLRSGGPGARTHRGAGPGPVGGDARRATPPARQDRADRQRELRLGGGHAGAGLVADQQVRRGPARQALLRWLRVRRRGRAARPGARPGALSGCRARQRPAALGCPGEHGGLLQRAPARRPDPGHEPGPWRPSDPRHGPQLLRPALRGPRLRRAPGTPSGSTTTRWRPRPARSDPG